MKKIESVCLDCGKDFEKIESAYNETYEEKYLCDSCRNKGNVIVFKKIGENLN